MCTNMNRVHSVSNAYLILTLLHPELSKLHGVLAVLSAIGLTDERIDDLPFYVHFNSNLKYHQNDGKVVMKSCVQYLPTPMDFHLQ